MTIMKDESSVVYTDIEETSIQKLRTDYENSTYIIISKEAFLIGVPKCSLDRIGDMIFHRQRLIRKVGVNYGAKLVVVKKSQYRFLRGKFRVSQTRGKCNPLPVEGEFHLPPCFSDFQRVEPGGGLRDHLPEKIPEAPIAIITVKTISNTIGLLIAEMAETSAAVPPTEIPITDKMLTPLATRI
jgi:hypothetical protein